MVAIEGPKAAERKAQVAGAPQGTKGSGADSAHEKGKTRDKVGKAARGAELKRGLAYKILRRGVR
jgi:hypothetical protein